MKSAAITHPSSASSGAPLKSPVIPRKTGDWKCEKVQRAQAPEFIEADSADHVLSITPYVALRYVGSRDDFGIFAATFALYSSVSVFYFSFWVALEILKMERRRTFSLGFSVWRDSFIWFHYVFICFEILSRYLWYQIYQFHISFICFGCRFLLLVTWLKWSVTVIFICDPPVIHQGGLTAAEASGLGHFGRHCGRANPISGATSGTSGTTERMNIRWHHCISRDYILIYTELELDSGWLLYGIMDYCWIMELFGKTEMLHGMNWNLFWPVVQREGGETPELGLGRQLGHWWHLLGSGDGNVPCWKCGFHVVKKCGSKKIPTRKASVQCRFVDFVDRDFPSDILSDPISIE